jgi:hypothetical protein
VQLMPGFSISFGVNFGTTFGISFGIIVGTGITFSISFGIGKSMPGFVSTSVLNVFLPKPEILSDC